MIMLANWFHFGNSKDNYWAQTPSTQYPFMLAAANSLRFNLDRVNDD